MKNITGAQGAFIARILIEAYQAKGRRLLEAGYTGQKKDKLGHTRYYSNGKQVKNPNATEKAAIHAAASTSLPAGQAPSHADAATRVNALHKDTPPEHVAALANDLMNMSVEDLTKLSKRPAITKVSIRDSSGNLVQKFKVENPNAQGDSLHRLFNSQEEAEEWVKNPKGDKQIDAWTPPPKPPEAPPKEKFDHDSFTETLPPKDRERAKKALEKEVRSGGAFITRKDLVKDKIKNGYKVTVSQKGERRLQNEQGQFMDEAAIGVTAMDYAEHLLKTNEPPATKTPAQSHNAVLDKHKADYKAATDFMDDADTLKGKQEGDRKQHEVVQSLADKLGVDYFDAYDMLEKENDEAGLTPGYDPNGYDPKKKDNITAPAPAPAEEPKQKRATKGGEVGPNGEHYKGGAFIATTEMPKAMKDKIKRAAGDGMETVRDLEGNVTREKPPHPGMMSISGTMMGTLIGRKGEVNEQYLDYLQASPEKRKQVADLAEKYRAGEHWAPINDYPNVALGKHIYQLAAAGLPIAGSLLGRLKGNADFQKYYKKQTEKAAPAAAPAPTPDKTPTAAANKPAFTGTDAQGRQWQDGELVAAKDKPPAPTAGMSADANALDALRLKSNKKTHNPAHINPEALSSLKAQGFIDDKNKLTPAGRTHLYAEKLKGAPAPTGSAAATPAAPKPKWKRANRNKDSLISIVKRKGGINSNSVKKDYDYQADIIEGGLLHAIRKQGMGLDEMAASLQVEGHIIVPEGVDPGDYLLDRMKGRHHSALRNTDKEIESEAEAFYKAQHEAKQGGHDERSIEGSRRSGAQTGKSAGQKEGATELDEWDNSGAGETGGGEKDATVSGDGYDSADTDDYDRNAGQDGPVDTSFDFGANADEPKADEPAPAPAPATPAPDQPGFTGIDSQGREWQNGKLVAAKDDEPAPAGKAEPEPEPKAKATPEPAPAAAAPALNNAPTTDDIKRTAAIQKEKSNNMHKGMEWNLADDGMVTVHHAVTGREIGKIDLDTKKLYPTRSDEDSKQKLSGIYDHLEKLTQTQSDREKIQSLLDRPHKGNNKNEILELNNQIAERGHKPEPVPDYLTPAAAPAAAAPDPDPVTEPSTPAAAAAEPQPNDTPRTVAARVSAAMADEFEGARNSTLPNMGQDTPGSARHKAMAWKGLKDAEANGTAEALVKRDELLKNDPSNLSSILAPENFLGVLTSHLTMQAFPKEVLTYAEYVKNEKHHVSTPAQLREQYYEAFTEIKKLTEDLSTKKLDPRVIASEVNKKINGLIEKFRKEGQGEPSARPGRRHDGDSYNPVANSLISMQKRVLGGGANSVVGRVNDFGKRLFTATGEMSYNSKEKAVSAVADILEGKSFNQAFDTVNQKKKEFDFNEAYGGEVTRTGGKKIDMSEQSTSSPGAKVFMDDMKVRGVQFGNSLPDQERVYHAQKSAEALSDLTSILGLPDEAAGLGGKLGLAIGARGKGGALAHFEPYQANDRHNPDVGGPVINLTRANGAGSLAHEWGHGLDHYAANNKAGGGKFLSHPEASRGGAGGSPETIEAMKKVQEAMGNSGFDNRLIDETVRRRFSGSRRQYWTSPEEKFARTFERHVQNKLHEAGRENTYLTGLHKQGHPLWPTNDEMAHMAPHMDALIAAIAAEKFPGHTMPASAPEAPKADNPAHAAWIKRGSNPEENRNAAFQAVHGRPPTFEELHGGPGGLIEKVKGKTVTSMTKPAAPKAPEAPAEEKPATATAAWKQRGSNEKESPYQSFQAIHGRPPSFDELHGDKFEKIKGKYVLKPNYEEVNGKYVLKPNQGGTITDVTPAGYGPGEADTPPAAPAPGKFLRMRDLKDAHRLPPDDLVKKHGWSWTGTDEKGNQWHNGRFIGEEGTYKEAVMPADPHAAKIKLIQAIIARRGITPPQPKAQAKKIPEANEDPRVKRIRELMDAYC